MVLGGGRARLRLVLWALAAGCFVLAVVVQHGLGIGLGAVGAGLVLIPVSWRSKARSEPGALVSQSADLEMGDGGRLPGQFSVTSTELIWRPSEYARRHGAAEIRLPNSGSLVIELRRGGALTDLKVELIPEGKAPLRLLTHRSRRLEAVLSPHVPR